MCSCNKGKNGASEFTVRKADGSTQTAKTEQEARTLVKIHGGSYTRVK